LRQTTAKAAPEECLGNAREQLSATTASEIAAHLGIAIDTPVLKNDRVTETADGAPLLWQILLTPFAP
jgi:DNA-binding GntR family transcriptional regulator